MWLILFQLSQIFKLFLQIYFFFFFYYFRLDFMMGNKMSLSEKM